MEKTVLCEISYVDGFGNIITNLRSEQISEFNINVSKRLIVSVGKKRFSGRYVKTYSDLGENDFGLLVGSHGFLEIACREKSAAKRFAARNGMRVRVLKCLGSSFNASSRKRWSPKIPLM